MGFWISDPIQDPDHLQPNLILTIQNTDYSRFQIPTVTFLLGFDQRLEMNSQSFAQNNENKSRFDFRNLKEVAQFCPILGTALALHVL